MVPYIIASVLTTFDMKWRNILSGSFSSTLSAIIIINDIYMHIDVNLREAQVFFQLRMLSHFLEKATISTCVLRLKAA